MDTVIVRQFDISRKESRQLILSSPQHSQPVPPPSSCLVPRMPNHARLRCLFSCLYGFAVLVAAQPINISWTASPFSPPAYPMAVRSPYLNTWLPQGNLNPSAFNVHTWPNFWNIDNTVTSWYASAVVDGEAYLLIGVAPIPGVVVADQTATSFTSTRTTVQLTAGPMQITVSFISPIEPTDLVRQSLPFSYMSISASSIDGNAHSLQLYSDISGEFITGNTSTVVEWTAEDTDDYVVLSMSLQEPASFTEVHDFAQDGTAYYSLKKKSDTTTSWAIGEDTVNRGTVANRSSLGNSVDPTFRAVSTFGNNQPVLGIAVDYGQVQSTSEPAVWALGVVRSPAVQYKTSSGSVEQRYPYFLSTYNDATTAAKAFLDDFTRAESAAASFDDQIGKAGAGITSNYSELLSLSSRQSMGCMDITLSKTDGGGWNMSDVKIFMKNMGGAGSDAPGSSSGVNTVDILYSAFPIFIYLNPELGKYLLTPLLEYQDSPIYTLSYSARNIGSSYPNATADGLDEGHEYGVEETANMLIMTLAYSQASGNTTLLQRHYSLLKRWGQYLIDNSLAPTDQRSADFSPYSDISTTNQTNLALKGIIGLGAMARISEMMNRSDDLKTFNDTATSFIGEWQSQALPPDQSHVNFFNGLSGSSGLIYNVYADKFLKLGLVPDSIYDVLTNFYNASLGQSKYGIPLSNTQSHNASTNWMMFAASAVSDNNTRNALIGIVHDYVGAATNFHPMNTNYDPTDGTFINALGNGANSPAQGAMFALLALNSTFVPSNETTPGEPPPPAENPGKGKNKLPIILGGVLAPMILCSIAVAVFVWKKRSRKARRDRARMVPLAFQASNGPPLTFAHGQLGASLVRPGEYQSTRVVNQGGLTVVPTDSATAADNSHSMGKTPAHEQAASEASYSQTGSSGSTSIRRLFSGEVRRREELREEVENLRREIERIREVRETLEDAPPSYSEHLPE